MKSTKILSLEFRSDGAGKLGVFDWIPFNITSCYKTTSFVFDREGNAIRFD